MKPRNVWKAPSTVSDGEVFNKCLCSSKFSGEVKAEIKNSSLLSSVPFVTIYRGGNGGLRMLKDSSKVQLHLLLRSRPRLSLTSCNVNGEGGILTLLDQGHLDEMDTKTGGVAVALSELPHPSASFSPVATAPSL